MKEEINMIDSYDKLSIGRYTQLVEVAGRPYDEDIDRQMEIVSILSGLSVKEIGNLLIGTYHELVEKAVFLEIECVPAPIKESYNVGGMELVPVSDYKKMSTAQYVDFQSFSKLGPSTIVEQLSCLLVPKGCKYNTDYDVLEVQKAIRDELMVPDAIALASFFLESWLSSMLNSLSYLEGKATGQTMEEIAKLQKQAIATKAEILRIVGGGSLA